MRHRTQETRLIDSDRGRAGICQRPAGVGRLLQLAGEQPEHDGVAPLALELRVRAKQALTGEPAALGDALGRMVVRAARQFQTSDFKVFECPPGDEADGAGRNAAPTSLGRKPVADGCPALLQLDVVQ